MGWFIDGITDSDPKKRLAFIADCTSIIGVSAATILGGIFTITQRVNIDNLVGVALFSLLGIAIFLLLFLFCYVLAKRAKNTVTSDRVERWGMVIIIWLCFSSVALLSAYWAYSLISAIKILQ